MQIPETDNIHFQYAFKVGYRLALEGKNMASMPSAVRRDLKMRDYFQQGWEQGHKDVSEGLLSNTHTCWKCRFIWGAIMILGGAATAYSIIYSYEKEQAELAQEYQIKRDQVVALKAQQDAINLSILSNQQREDLLANLAEEAQRPKPLPPLERVIQSPIKISIAQLTTQVKDEKPVDDLSDSIPKYIRELTFFTQIETTKPQTIYHRWRFNNQYLGSFSFDVDQKKNTIWSHKKMSSAWQGRWDVEILNDQKTVIYRKTFMYGTQQ